MTKKVDPLKISNTTTPKHTQTSRLSNSPRIPGTTKLEKAFRKDIKTKVLKANRSYVNAKTLKEASKLGLNPEALKN